MSNYEDEHGRFVLPSAEFAGFRQAMQKVEQQHKEQAFELTQEFWKGLSRSEQTNAVLYSAARRMWWHALTDLHNPTRPPHEQPWYRGLSKEQQRAQDEEYLATERWKKHLRASRPNWRYSGAGLDDDEVLATAGWWLDRKVQDRWDPETRRHVPAGSPARVQKGEVEWPTNRSTRFSIGEGSVSFDPGSRTVEWGVANNNHSVERARAGTLGVAFFERLNKVRWTPGTGGVIRYHSEYDRERSGWTNDASASYGYLGIEQEPQVHRDFTNAKGERIGAELKPSKYGVGWEGRPVKLVREFNRWGGGETWRKPTADEKRQQRPARTAGVRSGTGPVVRGKTTSASTDGSFAPRHRDDPGQLRL